jgi:hypothetical protein
LPKPLLNNSVLSSAVNALFQKPPIRIQLHLNKVGQKFKLMPLGKKFPWLMVFFGLLVQAQSALGCGFFWHIMLSYIKYLRRKNSPFFATSKRFQ